MTVSLTFLEPRSQSIPGGITALWALEAQAVVTPDAKGPNDNGVFVYLTSTDSSMGDRFAAVSSAPQMKALPLVRGGPGTFYRHSSALLLCRSLLELSQSRAKIIADISLLVKDWSKLTSLTGSDTVVVTPNSVTLPSDLIPSLDSDMLYPRISADRSRMLMYDADGVLRGVTYLQTPEDEDV